MHNEFYHHLCKKKNLRSILIKPTHITTLEGIIPLTVHNGKSITIYHERGKTEKKDLCFFFKF